MDVARKFILPSLLAAAVAFQATDLSRAVYVRFGLAPDCPIVGQNQRCKFASSHSGQGSVERKNIEPLSHYPARPAPAPRDKAKECPTCKMLAATRTFAFTTPATTRFTLPPKRLETVGYPILQHSDTANQTHARAPPKGELVL